MGTSGWSYPEWAKRFYPDSVKAKAYLEYYCTQFSAVELNASFYRLPQLKVVKGWRDRTPAQFRFCPKLSRYITHIKRLKEARAPLKLFFTRMAPLRAKLGPILVQLPPTLALTSPHVEPFFDTLKKKYGTFRFAIEARHDSWTSDAAMHLLEAYDLGWVIADSGGHYPERVDITSDFAYFRFHGPKELYASQYRKGELAPFARIARTWLKKKKAIWAFFNNDVNAYAPKNAQTFRELTLSD